MRVKVRICHYLQVSGNYNVELLEDPHEKDVQELAAMLGLRKVSGCERGTKVCVVCDLMMCHFRLDGFSLTWNQKEMEK